MPVDIFSWRLVSKAERERHERERHEHERCRRAWYDHYRALGLGHLRSIEHARKRAARGRFPT